MAVLVVDFGFAAKLLVAPLLVSVLVGDRFHRQRPKLDNEDEQGKGAADMIRNDGIDAKKSLLT